MGHASDTPLSRPFAGLADLLGKERKRLPDHSGKPAPRPIRRSRRKSSEKTGCGEILCFPDPNEERRLFQVEMADVTPLVRDRIAPKDPASRRNDILENGSEAAGADLPQNGDRHGRDNIEDRETVRRLTDLVETGSGFIVRHTPEYMEGRHPEVPAIVVDRLHRGDYSVQAHMDLHGMVRREAALALDNFLSEAVERRWRTVLLVHGRGLSSPGEPVLKRYVRQRLMSKRWRRWVLAFASARMCDGGAGAVYVLLRDRPVSGKASRRGHCI